MNDDKSLIGRLPISLPVRDQLREFKTGLGVRSYEQVIRLLLFMATNGGARSAFESGKLYRSKLAEMEKTKS